MKINYLFILALSSSLTMLGGNGVEIYSLNKSSLPGQISFANTPFSSGTASVKKTFISAEFGCG